MCIPWPAASPEYRMSAMTDPTVYAVTASVSPQVAQALGDNDATRARLVVAADSQAEALSALQVAGCIVFTSTFRRYGKASEDAREIEAAVSDPGKVFAFSLAEPDAAPVRITRA